MRTAALISLTLLTGFLLAVPGQARNVHRTHPARKQDAPPLTAAQLTGTYKQGEYGVLDVSTLPGGRIQFHFEGSAHQHSPGGPNVGEASGIVPLHHDMTVYNDKEDGGRMILRFAPRHLYVSQAGALGFGAGVFASGVYRKTSSRTPNFDPGND